MYFDFNDNYLETPTIESAISWREKMLVSLFVHVLFILLILAIPRLPMVQEAEARRLAHLAEVSELQRQRLLETERESERFVFVQPLVDIEALEALDGAVASDIDRTASTIERVEDPTNSFPFAEGNSQELMVAEDPVEGLDRFALISPDVDFEKRENESQDPESSQILAGDSIENNSNNLLTDGSESGDVRQTVELFQPFGVDRLESSAATDSTDTDVDRSLLGQALQNLDRHISQQSFNNPNGGSGQFGPWIQFDTKGIEFGPWIRRFSAQIRRNWQIPYAAMTMHGHVTVTFYVHKDGSITEILPAVPSLVQGFTNAALNALLWSNPTQPLPQEYPADEAFFTVTFFYNETPPATY